MNWNKSLGWLGITTVLTISYMIIPEMANNLKVPAIIPTIIWSSILSLIMLIGVKEAQR